MRGPVSPEGQWWADWPRLEREERNRLLSELQGQIRGHLPPGTEVQRTFLSCYPRHAFLRFVVPAEFGPREGYAFYAPGQLYPLDWDADTIKEFNNVALEIRGAEQAEAFLRFAMWGVTARRERRFFVEEPGELNFEEPISAETEAALLEVVRPLEQVESDPADAEGSFRFNSSPLHAGLLRVVDWVVDSSGEIDWHVNEDLPSVKVPVPDDPVESDRFFVLVRESSLTAEGFLRRMRGGPVHQARVTETIVLRGEVFAELVSLSQVTFERGLDFEGAHFEKGLTIEQCVFEGQLNLREAHVQGPLNAPGLWFHREGTRRTHDSLKKSTRYGTYLTDFDASGMNVDGSAYFEGLRCPNVADLSRVHVSGDLRFSGSRIGESRPPSLVPRMGFALRLDASEVEGDLDFVFGRSAQYNFVRDPDEASLDDEVSCFSSPYTVVGGTLWAVRLHVHGSISMAGLRVEGDLAFDGVTVGAALTPGAHNPSLRTIVLGSFRAHGADIGGTIVVDGMYVGRDVLFHSTRVGGHLFGRTSPSDTGRVLPVHIGGALGLSGAQIHDVDFEGASIGSLQFITGEIGRLQIGRGRVDVPAQAPEKEGTEPRSIRESEGNVGTVTILDVTIRKRLRIVTEVRGPIRIGNLDCGGDVQFFGDLEPEEPGDGEQWADGSPSSRFEQRTTVAGDLECTGVKVAGRLVLTNVSADGRIMFKNCTIAQDLNCQALGPDPTSTEGRTRTECHHLDLELTRCGGDVDLAGLHVTGDEGSVHARQLQVEGRILMARALDDHADQVELADSKATELLKASVAKDLDLSVASTAQLVIAGGSFGGIVNLERGHFRRLDIIEPLRFKKHNLSDIQVDRWEIAEEHLRTFLDRSDPFARDTYVQIERALRNKAQDAQADGVYRGMRARAIREAKRERRERQGKAPPEREESESGDEREPGDEALSTRAGSSVSYLLRTVGSRLQGALYGWGTLYWAPLLVLSLVFVPLSWATFSNPANIVGTSELVAATPGADRDSGPGAFGVEWDASDGFWLMVQYHVPVVPLTAQEGFRLTSAPAVVPLLGGLQARMSFSAESYSSAVYLLHWILWPLFLVGLARRIVRETT